MSTTFAPTLTPSPTITFGFARLDQLLGGAKPGQLIVLAGWPLSGLSSLARHVAEHVAETLHHPTGFVLFDADEQDHVEAMLLSRAKVGAVTVQAGTASDEDRQRIATAAEELARLPLYFDASPTASLDDLCARLPGWLGTHVIRLLIVDGFEASESVGPNDPPSHLADLGESPEVIRRLKALALELGLVVLVLCRLPGGPELSDLGGCDDLATHADTVLLLHRDATDDRSASIVVAKHPEGIAGSVPLTFQPDFLRFEARP